LSWVKFQSDCVEAQFNEIDFKRKVTGFKTLKVNRKDESQFLKSVFV